MPDLSLFSVAGDFETDKHIEFIFDVALGEPEVFKGKAIIETLFQLAELIEGIVTSFE